MLVVRSTKQARAQNQALLNRLSKAEAALTKLAPAPARGKRPVRDEVTLQQHILAVLDRFDVGGLIDVSYAQIQMASPTSGQSYFQITDIRRAPAPVRGGDAYAIEQRIHHLAWRAKVALRGAMVSNVSCERLSLTQLALIYRQGWGKWPFEGPLERHFHQLKDAPLGLSPLWVRLDHQIQGLTHLLTLGLRVLTTIEFAIRENLKQANEQLSGLYPGNPNRHTAHPTALMVLKAFARAEPTLTVIRTPSGQRCHITPLPPHLCCLLHCLQLPLSLYHRLQLPLSICR